MPQNNLSAKPAMVRDYENLANLFYGGASFVVFDTETTGLEPTRDHLTEIGAVKFNCRQEIESFDQLIKPPVPIPHYPEQLTHITNEMVAGCPGAAKVLDDFLSFIGGTDSILIAHNAPFDLGFLNAQMARMGRPIIQNRTIDSLPLARWVHPEFRSDTEKGPYKLQTLAKRFNIKVRSAHRADDDARVLKELFLRLLSDSIPRQKNFDPSIIPRREDELQLELDLF